MMSRDDAALRRRMVETQIRARGVLDPRVLRAMETVPRHLFVPEELAASAYLDEPLPIGYGQTISQPYIVAYMTELLKLRGDEKVLEVGTGSGYQTAVLAALASEVWTVEIVAELSGLAKSRLDGLGCTNVHYRIGDGSEGWPETGPFDAIMVTAAPAAVPGVLEGQLSDSGRMIIPVGEFSQSLFLVRREGRTFQRRELIGVRFVPLVRGG